MATFDRREQTGFSFLPELFNQFFLPSSQNKQLSFKNRGFHFFIVDNVNFINIPIKKTNDSIQHYLVASMPIAFDWQ